MVGMTPVSSIFVVCLCTLTFFSRNTSYIFDIIAEEYQDIIGIRLDNSTGPLVGSKAFDYDEAKAKSVGVDTVGSQEVMVQMQ